MPFAKHQNRRINENRRGRVGIFDDRAILVTIDAADAVRALESAGERRVDVNRVHVEQGVVKVLPFEAAECGDEGERG